MAKIFYIIILGIVFLAAGSVLAQQPNPNQQPDYGLDISASVAGLKSDTPPTLAQVMGMIINAGLGLVGVIYLILIIYAGFQWMTAGGNEETVTKAKKRLVHATIGLVIVFMAFVITNFLVFTVLGISLGTYQGN